MPLYLLAFILNAALIGCSTEPSPEAGVPFDNEDPVALLDSQSLAEIRSVSGLEPAHNAGFYGGRFRDQSRCDPSTRPLLAVLDNGFRGWEKAVNLLTLPPDTIGPQRTGSNTSHGARMAQIAYQTMANSTRYNPNRCTAQIQLMVTSGSYSNLQSAVNRLISIKQAQPNRIVMVLYAQVWRFGSNRYPGRVSGYIDTLVNQALAAGVNWVNATGNFALATKEVGSLERWLRADSITQFSNPYPQPVDIVLGWSSFSDQDPAAAQDPSQLTLMVITEQGDEHRSSTTENLPYRRIRLNLPAGTHTLKAASTTSQSHRAPKAWIAINSPGVTIVNSSSSAFAPAHLNGVLAVTAVDSFGEPFEFAARTGTVEPPLSCLGLVSYANGRTSAGTSEAAAICAAAMLVKITYNSNSTDRHSSTELRRYMLR